MGIAVSRFGEIRPLGGLILRWRHALSCWAVGYGSDTEASRRLPTVSQWCNARRSSMGSCTIDSSRGSAGGRTQGAESHAERDDETARRSRSTRQEGKGGPSTRYLAHEIVLIIVMPTKILRLDYYFVRETSLVAFTTIKRKPTVVET